MYTHTHSQTRTHIVNPILGACKFRVQPLRLPASLSLLPLPLLQSTQRLKAATITVTVPSHHYSPLVLHTLLRSRQTGETGRRRRWWQQRQQQRQRQWQSKQQRQWQWQRPVRMRSASVVVFSLTRPPQTMQPSRLHSVVRVSSRATTSSSSSHFCLCSIANLCRIIAARNVVACGTSKLTLRPEHAATMRRSVCNE